MEKNKKTQNLNSAIKNRWSPKLFLNRNVSGEEIELLLEAASWAPSARNEQPWLYYYCIKSDDSFHKVVNFLDSGNQKWAKYAPLLIVSVVKKFYEYKNRPNKNALHDLGAANVSLAIQASEMGMQAHQMGGFDKGKISRLLNLDSEKLEPVTVIAVGYPGQSENHPDDIEENNKSSRKRNSVKDFAIKIT